MLSETCRAAMRSQETVEAIANYVVVIFDDGDYLNDFLTHVPECGQSLVTMIGQLLGYAIGF